MAQHIEIRKLPQKKFQKIANSIERAVISGSIKGSLKFQKRYGEIQDGCEVYDTWRHIGKGIVYGTSTGDFEVHIKGGKAEHIFLVA